MKKRFLTISLLLYSLSVTGSDNSIANFIQRKFCTGTFAQNCQRICGKTCDTFNCSAADIPTSALVTSIKALNRLPIDPVKDFPEGVASFTAQQQEEYREEFTRNIACVLGNPVGWKLALSTATKQTPTLGYTEPIIGQLLNNMIICEANPVVFSNYATLPIHEVDLCFIVSNSAINQATTPQEILANIDAIIPCFELAAGFTESFSDLAGPTLGGNSLITLLNGLARLFVLGNPIPITARSTDQWIAILSGNIKGKEEIIRASDVTTLNFTNANYMAFAQSLINNR